MNRALTGICLAILALSLIVGAILVRVQQAIAHTQFGHWCHAHPAQWAGLLLAFLLACLLSDVVHSRRLLARIQGE